MVFPIDNGGVSGIAGESLPKLAVQLLDSKGLPMAGKKITWSILSSSAANPTTGVFYPVSGGTTPVSTSITDSRGIASIIPCIHTIGQAVNNSVTMNATYQNISQSFTTGPIVAASAVKLSTDVFTVASGDSQLIYVTLHDAFGNPVDNKAITIQSSNSNDAVVLEGTSSQSFGYASGVTNSLGQVVFRITAPLGSSVPSFITLVNARDFPQLTVPTLAIINW
jgi:hypothetical protein